jgi:citrate lyase beta subunit
MVNIRMRSKLFVPGSRPELFAKAFAGRADAISIDLEDAVLETRKEDARTAVAQFLRSLPAAASPASGPARAKVVIVRVNDPTTRHYDADLAAVACAGLSAVNLPKVENPEVIREAARRLAAAEQEQGIPRPIGILVNIESPKGLRRAAELATADRRVVGLQVGFGDLFEPLGIDRRDEAAVGQILLAVRLAAGEAGLPAFDGAWANVADSSGFEREAARARRLGFAGKSCIHPSQVEAANRAFAASPEEVAFARRVIAAWVDAEAQGRGAIMVEGKMIDKPFVERAHAILAESGAEATTISSARAEDPRATNGE